MRPFRSAGLLGALTLAVAVPAFGAIAPLDSQVNNDVANSIDPARSAGEVDVAGGSLTAGGLEVPWAAFEQSTSSATNIFVRAFKNGQWVTEGFPASLNIDSTQNGEAPAIDFAGAGRAVPWVSWYEPNTNLAGGATNIFASRFAANPAATGGGAWVAEGQDRAPAHKVPSLNIHTNRTAENPSVAGGATVAGNDPVPWIAWEENDGLTTDLDSSRQIFVSKGVKQSDCTGFKPSANASVSNFCWQQVGADRLAAAQASITSSSIGDPTLNVDPTRAGVEPDAAFTGTSDVVPWVVWYEQGDSQFSGFRSPERDQVFAAKAVADGTADGGFHWVAVGSGTASKTEALNTSGATNHFGDCVESQANDDACALNADPTHDAENPRVAAGSLTAGTPTVPWVVWQEDPGNGKNEIFVAHLVSGTHFELFNNGSPISNTVNDATDPDIAFSGHEPYISWHESVGGKDLVFLGHFVGGAAAPAFVLDTPNGIPAAGDSTAGALSGQIAALSSTCTATPFSADGTTCPGGALGTPFTLLTTADSPQRLLGEAYAPDSVTTGAATGVTASGATLNGTAVSGGAPIRTGFDVGPTTSYGSSFAAALLGDSGAAQAFSSPLDGLTAGTTIHYRATASSDFTTITGQDVQFTTSGAGTPPTPTPASDRPPSSKISGLARRVMAAKLKGFRGTASDPDDNVASVRFALLRVVKKRCSKLTSKGTFKHSSCKPSYLRATGTTHWRFRLRTKLAKGSYRAYSRAVDKAGKVETKRTSSNTRALRVT